MSSAAFNRIVPAYSVSGIDKVRMLLFGPPKCGKTTWIARNAPKPLIIDVEKGVVSLLHDPVMRTIPTYPEYTDAKISELIEMLASPEGNQFETIVFDTATEWQAKLLDGVVKGAGRPNEPQIQDYNYVGRVMRNHFVSILGMNKHFIVTAHTQMRKFGAIEKTAPALPPKVAETVEGLFPIIAYMQKRVDKAQQVQTKMFFVDQPNLVAGNRVQLPAVIENPTFQDLLNATPKEPVK